MHEYMPNAVYGAIKIEKRHNPGENMQRTSQRLIAVLAIAGGVSLLAAIFHLHFGTLASADEAVTLQGSGATFPAPLYERWFAEYNKAHPNVQINYQAIGSGAGIKQFQQHLVDFAPATLR